MSLKTIGVGIVIGAVFEGLKAVTSANSSIIKLGESIAKLEKKKATLQVDSKAYDVTQKKIDILGSSVEKLKNRRVKIDAIVQSREDFKSQIVEKVALGGAIAIPVKLAIDFESSMSDVRKVVDFKDTQEFQSFSNSILELSRSIPKTAEELAQITASGGQMGIAKNSLIGFTTVVAKMSTAFDMSASDAGDSMGRLMNIFTLSTDKAKELGDAINYIDNNSAAKSRDIVNVLGRVGGISKVVGLSPEGATALASAFLTQGVASDVTATAMNALLLKLATPEQQNKGFQRALVKLGTTAQELKKDMDKNPEKTLGEFLQKLSKLKKEEKMPMIAELFGAEYSDDISLLVGGLHHYEKAKKMLSKKSNYKDSMEKEFQARSDTTANNIQLLGNGMKEIGIHIGSVLLPALNAVITPLRVGATLLSELSEKPYIGTAIKIISGLAIGVVGLGLALSASSFIGGFVAVGFLKLANVFTVLSGAIRLVGLSLVTNPIGLILLAIAGAGYLIYTNWDKISGVLSDVSNWFSTLWSDMKKIEILGFKPFEALENGLSSLKKSALDAWGEVLKVFNFTNKSDESSVSIAKSDTQAPKFRVQAPKEVGVFRSVDIWASGLWNKFLGDIKKGWGGFTSGFFEGFDISSIKKDLEPLKTLFKTLESDFEPIGKKLGEHFETLAKHLGKLKSSALDAWGEVKKFFGVEDKKTPTTDKVAKPKIQKVEIKTKGFFESISAGMTLKGIGKGIGTAFNLASRAISIGLGYVSKILLSLRNGAINAFNAISSGISKAGANIQSVWNGVFNWFSSKFAWLSGIFNRVSNFASSIASMGSNLLATPAPVMVGSGYQKALNNSSVVTRNIVRNPPSSVKNRSSVTNQNHYATTVHISNPANGFDIQKQVLKALKAHSEKNKNTSIKGR